MSKVRCEEALVRLDVLRREGPELIATRNARHAELVSALEKASRELEEFYEKDPAKGLERQLIQEHQIVQQACNKSFGSDRDPPLPDFYAYVGGQTPAFVKVSRTQPSESEFKKEVDRIVACAKTAPMHDPVVSF
jgi:hypothetical protein